jgi:predicted Zn-dependent peptidase
MRSTAGALARRLARLLEQRQYQQHHQPQRLPCLEQQQERAFAASSSNSPPPYTPPAPPANRGGIDTAADVTREVGGQATLAPAIAPFPSWLPRSRRGEGEGSAGVVVEDIGRVSTPLTQPLPPSPSPLGRGGRRGGAKRAAPSAAASPPTRTTVLANGAAVVTEASTGPTSSLGVYVDCGSVHEAPGVSLGASAMLECSAFGATRHRPGQALARAVERLGASVSANASREQMAYTVDCLRSHVPMAAELLLDATLCPAFDAAEVEANKARLRDAVSPPAAMGGGTGAGIGGGAGGAAGGGGDVQLALLAEHLLREAYRGSPLANPLIPAACVSEEEAAAVDARAAQAEAVAESARTAALASGTSEDEAEQRAAEARAAAAETANDTSSGSHPYVRALPLDHLTPESLRAFHRQRFFSPGSLVVAAAGVDHDELVALVEPMLLAAAAEEGGRHRAASSSASSSSSSSFSPAPPKSLYKGGHVHLPGQHPQSHLILAFEYSGGWRDVQGSVIMTVLTYLLGGGASFSSGGPGKGMHSRLYTRVLNAHAWAHSCAAFSSAFNDTGLVGIQASCEPGRAAQMLDVCCRELEALSDPVAEEQVSRARAMAASLVAGALESKAASAEDVGRQHLTYGRRVSGSEYLAMIRAVTPRQVAEFARGLLSTRPSLATFGGHGQGLLLGGGEGGGWSWAEAAEAYARVEARYVVGAGGAASGAGGARGGAGAGGARSGARGVEVPAAAGGVGGGLGRLVRAAWGGGAPK